MVGAEFEEEGAGDAPHQDGAGGEAATPCKVLHRCGGEEQTRGAKALDAGREQAGYLQGPRIDLRIREAPALVRSFENRRRQARCAWGPGIAGEDMSSIPALTRTTR